MAKFYIYRNLHTGGFSVKQRGLVIDRDNWFVAYDALFKVNEIGRQRVIREKKKNVHAYTVCDRYEYSGIRKVDGLQSITYNPYKSPFFTCNGIPISSASKVLFKSGKCYLVKK